MSRHEPSPISLSDTELDAVMQAAAPLHPLDRPAFLSSITRGLRYEPEVGPGTINRVIRELLATKQYRLETALAVGSTLGMARHNGRSALREGAPIARSRNK
jgi:hypothetical protein